MQYSRLARRTQQLTTRQSYLLLAGAAALLILFIIYGFPAVINLAGAIGGLRHNASSSAAVNTIVPTTPTFAQSLTATSSAQITISGVADPKATVEVSQNGNILGSTVTDDSGQFSYDVTLNHGDNVFTAIAVTDSGIKSLASDSYKVSYLTAKPNLTVTSPKDGDKVTDSPITLSGSTDPGDSVTVNGFVALVKDDGSFSYNLTLNDGDNKVKVIASDPAGNQTTQELTVSKQSP
ncbi:MAG: hypothetical protein M1484_01505 [Patescibacteria group bacterium]|nr:hypothetical protein [Patescibacteria group bacterium]MCL5431757.1 hypothetical protein [Patescibacteria group bacterium]